MIIIQSLCKGSKVIIRRVDGQRMLQKRDINTTLFELTWISIHIKLNLKPNSTGHVTGYKFF